MNQMDLFADEAAKLWASEVERETSTESLELPETSSSQEPQSSESVQQDQQGADLELPQDSVATDTELPTAEDQDSEGDRGADTEYAEDSPEQGVMSTDFPEDVVPQDAGQETSRIALDGDVGGGGLPDIATSSEEPDSTRPTLPDVEFPEDRSGDEQTEQSYQQDVRQNYQDAFSDAGQDRQSGGSLGGGEDHYRQRGGGQIELPGDFDERLRFVIQPELDQLQDALGNRTADIIAENAILASLSVVPE